MVTEDGTLMSRQEFQDLVEQRRQEKKAAKKTSSQFSIDQLLEKVRLCQLSKFTLPLTFILFESILETIQPTLFLPSISFKILAEANYTVQLAMVRFC